MQLLEPHPSAPLRVYAVWLPMLGSDAREAWVGTTMPDPRVLHFWDEEREVGQWFAKEVDGYNGVAWDIYYLYGPEAVWEDIPSPLVGSGGTIIHKRETLEREVNVLLEE